ncbi:MAG: hypothetical protein ACLS3S_09425 [Streptococcus salivarius]
MMTTTVTEQASAQASVSAIETVGTNSQVVTSVVSRETTAQVQTSQLPVGKWQFLRKLKLSAQETQTTEQASQGQTSTQVAGQTSTQSTSES